MKRLIKIFLFLALLGNGAVFAQAGAEKLPGLLKSKKFTFYATSAIPQNSADLSNIMRNIPGSTGSFINLDGGYYDLVIKPDSVIAFLPFFGRNYTPNYDRDDQGFDFTSTDFTYVQEKTKKGWNISIRPKDVKNDQRLMLNITSTGYATLNINSNSKSAISFNGYVDAPRPPKKKKAS